MLGRILVVGLLAAAGFFLRNQVRQARGSRMSTTTESIEVNVPVSTAYNQWTQFELFPRFMAGVLEVRQLDDTHLRWRAEIGGQEKEWDAEITEQIPDTLIAWRSSSGAQNQGMVSFKKVSDSRTRIVLRIDYQPRGITESIGDLLGAVSMRASGNLQRFKQFLESRGSETGAWRGVVSAAEPSVAALTPHPSTTVSG